MNPVEDALIRRLDARGAFAKVLGRQNQRNRAILVDKWRHGWNEKEIGRRFGLSSNRVNQICQLGLDGVQQALKERSLPSRFDFDKAAFLEHMRWLISRREIGRAEAKERTWRKEMDVMRHFVALATPPPKPPPRPAPPVGSTIRITYSSHVTAAALFHAQPTTSVEPWFDPNRTPTDDDLSEIAKYATGYYAAALRVPHPGLEPPGKVLFSFSCARDADIIAGGLYQRRLDFPVAELRFAGIRVTRDEHNVMIAIGFE